MNSRPVPNPYLRVSDAERGEVADILKQHATDGRLDSAEFEARLDRTLRAKTRADLAGLLDDLPDLNPARGAGYRPGPYGYGPNRYDPNRYDPNRYDPSRSRQRPPGHPILWTLITVALVLTAFFATLSAIASASRPDFAWLVVLIVAVVLWRRAHGYHHWRG